LSQTIVEKEKEKAERLASLTIWARDVLGQHGVSTDTGFHLVSASDDASFRRYFRPITTSRYPGSRGYVFVDAPPAHENNEAYVYVSEMLTLIGVRVPKIYAADLKLGYMMVDDFGSRLCLDAFAQLDYAERGDLVHGALEIITSMQLVDVRARLPDYDNALFDSEMSLFVEWFVERQLMLKLSSVEKLEFDRIKKLLCESALGQPVVFVHRDYHSRNLMVLDDGQLGVIDFQDAVMGPVTYDLVSLFKDCYYRFPRGEVCVWVENFRLLLLAQGRIDGISSSAFLKWFDLMGMQRHLKCAGIFSRLNLRDSKERYLADIPLVITYLVETCDFYPEFSEFGNWLKRQILPVIESSDFKMKVDKTQVSGE